MRDSTSESMEFVSFKMLPRYLNCAIFSVFSRWKIKTLFVRVDWGVSGMYSDMFFLISVYY